jgi:hypothetical protein
VDHGQFAKVSPCFFSFGFMSLCFVVVCSNANLFNMYISAMLRDKRFEGKGHIMSKSSNLAVSAAHEAGGLPVMNAVDILRLLIIGDVGGVCVATMRAAKSHV